MGSLSNNAVVLIVSNALKYAVGFVLPMMLVRLMTRGDFGTYQQLTLLGKMGSNVMMFGLPLSLYYFYRRSHIPTLVAQTQVLLLVFGLATGIAIAVFAPFLASHMHDVRLQSLLPLFAIYVGLNIFGELFMHVMINRGSFRTELRLEVIEAVFRVTVLVSLAALGYSLRALVFALVAYAALRALVRSYWLWSGPDSVRNASWSERFPGKQLKYSVPLGATTCVGVIGALFDKMIVAFAFSPVTYAIYSIGALEVPLDSIFQKSVASVLLTSLPLLIAEERFDEVVRIWRESVRKLALIMVPSFIFLSAFAHLLITTLFTHRYVASVPVFRVYLFELPLYMFVLSVVPQVFGRPALNLYISAIMLVTNAVLSLILLHYFGILGPAMAFVFANYVGAISYLVVTSRLLKLRMVRLMPLGEIGRTVSAALIALLPAMGVQPLTKGVVCLVLVALSFAVVYGVSGLFLRAFQPSDVTAVASWLRRMIPGTSR